MGECTVIKDLHLLKGQLHKSCQKNFQVSISISEVFTDC